jgi:plastocyanin
VITVRLAAFLLIAVVVLGVTGCGAAPKAGSPTTPAGVKPDKNTVVIRDYRYDPAVLTISKGETVTWINQDSVAHTATGKGFDSGLLNRGSTYKFTFKDSGAFDYICTPHPYMKGSIVVK